MKLRHQMPIEAIELSEEGKIQADEIIESQIDDYIDLRHHGEHGRHI